MSRFLDEIQLTITPEGEQPFRVDAKTFARDNDGDPTLIDDLLDLELGDSLLEGGGASPFYVITRVM